MVTFVKIVIGLVVIVSIVEMKERINDLEETVEKMQKKEE